MCLGLVSSLSVRLYPAWLFLDDNDDDFVQSRPFKKVADLNSIELKQAAEAARVGIEQRSRRDTIYDYYDNLRIKDIVEAEKQTTSNGKNYEIKMRVETTSSKLKCFAKNTCGTQICSVSVFIPDSSRSEIEINSWNSCHYETQPDYIKPRRFKKKTENNNENPKLLRLKKDFNNKRFYKL